MKTYNLFPVLILAVALLSFGCGGEEQAKPEVEDTSSTLQVEKLPMTPDEIFPEKTLQLVNTRYMKEMIREEGDRAYAGSGEYIDPEKVIALVRNVEYQPVPEATLKLDLPKKEQDKLTPVKTWRISQISHNEAKELFEAGDYPAAAEKWKNLLTDERAFTISIEVDCSIEVLKESYARIADLQMPVFIQEEKMNGRSCYRLCAGVFAEVDEPVPFIATIKERLKESFPFAMPVSK